MNRRGDGNGPSPSWLTRALDHATQSACTGMANLRKLLLNRSDMNININNGEYQRRSSPRLPCVEESLLDKAYGIISTSNSWMVAATAQPCRHLARDHPAGDHPRKDTTLQQALPYLAISGVPRATAPVHHRTKYQDRGDIVAAHP